MSSLTTNLGTLSLDGVATGMNTAALINELVSAASGPRNAVQTRITEHERLSTLYANMNSKISAINSALTAMDTTAEFRAYTGTSSDTDVLSVSTGSSAVPGSYTVTVGALAKAQIHNVSIAGTTSFSSSSTAIFESGETGDISITVNGTASSITVSDTMTLSQLAAEIDDIEGVSAYVVQTATEAATGADAFQLFVQADTAGLNEGAARFSIDMTGLDNYVVANYYDTELQAGTNATATIAGQTITSATNSFTAIEGITFTATSTGTATATVALDTAAMAAKVEAFVTAYNDLVTFITSNSNFSSSGTNQTSVTMGAFVGESTPRYVKQLMANLISADYGTALGLDSSTQRTSLSQMGISTNRNGTLSFSSSAFSTTLSSYQSSVEAIFGSDTGSFSDSMQNLIDDFINTTDGTIPTLRTKLGDAVERLESSLAYHNTRLTKYRARLTAQFTRLESMTSLMQGTQSFLTSFFAPEPTN